MHNNDIILLYHGPTSHVDEKYIFKASVCTADHENET